jgi:homoserine kinase type II
LPGFPLVDDLQDILNNYAADCRSAQLLPLGNAGGLSGAQFWRLVAPRGALVLRCWPIEQPSAERLAFIHAVLRHAAARGMTILPVPIPTMRGETFVRHAGRLWELAPWLPGTADYDRSPSREKLRAAMAALATFHVAVADFPIAAPRFSAPAVVHRLARLRELQSGDCEVLDRAMFDSSWPELAPLAREFVGLLPRVLPQAIDQLVPFADEPMLQQVCIRDLWHDHILFDGDRVSGIVDFGAVNVDTPATDIARLLGSLVGDEEPLWREGLDAYAQVRPLSDAERQAIPALDAAGTILAGCNWIRWIYVDGRQFDDPAQIVTHFERLLVRVRRLAER